MRTRDSGDAEKNHEYRHAESAALDAIAMYETGPAEQRSYGDEALARVAAADRTDRHHDSCTQLLTTEPQPLTTTAMVIAETAYLLDRELGPRVEALLYQSILDKGLTARLSTAAPSSWPPPIRW